MGKKIKQRFSKLITKCFKKEIQYYFVGFILEMQEWFDILKSKKKSINKIYNINRWR